METVQEFKKGMMYFRFTDGERDRLFFPTDDVGKGWNAFVMVPLSNINSHYNTAATGGLLPQEERNNKELGIKQTYALADDEGIKQIFRIWNAFGQEEFTLRYFMEEVLRVGWLLDEEKQRLKRIYGKLMKQKA